MARYPGVRKRGKVWFVGGAGNGRWHEERTEAKTAKDA